MEIKNKALFKNQCYINGEWVNSNNNKTIEKPILKNEDDIITGAKRKKEKGL